MMLLKMLQKEFGKWWIFIVRSQKSQSQPYLWVTLNQNGGKVIFIANCDFFFENHSDKKSLKH